MSFAGAMDDDIEYRFSIWSRTVGYGDDVGNKSRADCRLYRTAGGSRRVPAVQALATRGLINSAVRQVRAHNALLRPVAPWLLSIFILTIAEGICRVLQDFISRRLEDDLNLELNGALLVHAAGLDVSFFEDPRLRTCFTLRSKVPRAACCDSSAVPSACFRISYKWFLCFVLIVYRSSGPGISACRFALHVVSMAAFGNETSTRELAGNQATMDSNILYPRLPMRVGFLK